MSQSKQSPKNKIPLAPSSLDPRASMEALNLRIQEDQADRDAQNLKKRLNSEGNKAPDLKSGQPK